MGTTTLQTQQIEQVNNSPYTQQKATIEIGALEAIIGILAVILAIGIAYGTLRTLVKGIIKTLDKMEPHLKDINDRFIVVEDRVDTIWKDRVAPANSPRELNDKGKEIESKSGIKEILNEKKDGLIKLIKEKAPNNAYDAEKEIYNTVMELPKHYPDSIDKLKDGAFKVGADIDVVLFVGAIYLRNEIFEELGFSLQDLDK